jgi:hypothetical protein
MEPKHLMRMKDAILTHGLIASTFVSAAICTGQTTSPPEVPDVLPPSALELKEPLVNRVSLSYRMGLNIKVDFKKLGGFPRMTDPGPDTGSTYNRAYDNGGYNKVDISGNAGGMTWNWGYENPAAISGDNISLHSSASPNNVSTGNQRDDPQHGFELSYQRELYRKPKWQAGVEVAFAFSPIAVSDNHLLYGDEKRITDTYSLGGIVPPLAPYQGTFEGPGPLISSSPARMRTFITDHAIVYGKRSLDSDIYLFRLGPYAEIPIYKKLSAILSGGLTLAVADSTFSYNESVTINGVGTASRSSSGSQTDFLVGGYVGLALSYAISEKVSAFAGFQYQAAGTAVTDSKLVGNSLSQKEAVIDLGNAMVVTIGATYKF